ncbi:MAG TPA: hypothetical protein VK966_00080 [Longimicrobiales bacterium]|nr:hypothetical protein [Longimicrobiales bacterium]
MTARKLRRLLHMAVPAAGMALVVGAVLFGESLMVQLLLVVAGLLMTEAGLWRLADPLLPDERRYMALRAETDHFMSLVRQLNSAVLALGGGEADRRGTRYVLDEVRAEMHRSVDRMVDFAGKTEAEVPREAAGRSVTDVEALEAVEGD